MSADVLYDRRFDPRRITIREEFALRPARNDVLDSYTPYAAATDLARLVANKGWEVTGTNSTTALVTYAAGGGITITTAGAAADQMLVGAHVNTVQGRVKNIDWLTQKELSFEIFLLTGSVVTQAKFFAGFKLTSTPVVATDDDQIYFRYDATTVATAMTFVASRAGTDVTTTLSTDRFAVIAASTAYRLRFDVLANRTVVASMAVGNTGNLTPIGVAPLPALTTGIALLPFFGVEGVTTVAKAITVQYVELGKLRV